MGNRFDIRAEGGAIPRLVHQIRRHGYNAGDTVRYGTVTANPPQTKINIDGMKYDLEHDDFALLEHISPLKVGERVAIVMHEGGQRYTVLGKIVL